MKQLYKDQALHINIKAVLSIICMIACTINTQAQWSKQNSGSTTDYFRSVYFVNKSKGFAVGGGFISRSTIFMTEDAGKTWTRTYEGTDNEAFNQVIFVNENTGFIVGDSSGGGYPNIRKTMDGGKTWHLYTKTLPNGGSFDRMCFSDSLHGWIAGANMSIHCMYTTDGGQNWKQSASTVYEDDGFIYFKDNMTGWVFGGESSTGAPVFKKSTDGGVTWSNSPLFSGVVGIAQNVYFPNAQTGFVTSYYSGKYRLYKSTNSGQSFTQVTNITDTLSLNKIQFTSAMVGYMSAQGANRTYMLRTTDGGNSWALEKNPLNNGEYLTDFYMVDDNTGFAVGGNGVIIGRNGSSGIVPSSNPENGISIFPNPLSCGKTTLNLTLKEPVKGSLSISDHTGRLIWQNTEQYLITGNNIIQIPVNILSPGLYIISLQGGNINHTEKLIVQ